MHLPGTVIYYNKLQWNTGELSRENMISISICEKIIVAVAT